MKRNCLIISGGDFAPISANAEDCFIIACDRGYAYAKRCGLIPDLVVSDFDSYDGEIDPSVPVRRFPSEKDDTDTMLAIRTVLDLGYSEATLCCALGGRLDHTLANLQSAVFAAEHGLRLRILSPDTEILALRNGSVTLPRREGFSLSVFSASDCARGVSIRGTKYVLDRVSLRSSFPLGVSNEWEDEQAEITVEEGTLLIVCSRL